MEINKPYIMKYYLLLILFWAAGYSQIDLEKDTLHLQEAVVTNLKFRGTRSIRYSSICSHLESLTYYTEFVTLVDKLPPGMVKSVYFKFNNWNEKDTHTNYKFDDTRLEIVFYEADKNNKPGNKLTIEPIIVTVPKEQSGRMKFDLAKHNIISNGKIFVGLRRITKNKGKKEEFEVDGICDDKKGRYISYERKDVTSKWSVARSNKALKLELQVSILK